MKTHTKETRELLISKILELQSQIKFQERNLGNKHFEDFVQFSFIEIECLEMQLEFYKTKLIEG
jgi:hypothetical protein